ncbi:hypothetical protein JVT61DRAFT_12481 [Boletus reticuloceps]|uniref:Uncharacterized protein n=1 Tax=Boletus reticuloceps TaxID=495285 RepID=A0A8I2YDY4_9AGAM|nr:hypothetical protein JVT61DRAFT_12481 [Boletus reticuloceps]
MEAWADAFPNCADLEQYAATIMKNPIKSGCSVVIAIRSSGLCSDDFLDTIKLSNTKNWFQAPGSPITTVLEHELKHNANTRWDSTYGMMDCLIELCLLVNYFLGLPNHCELKKLKLSNWQWIVLGNKHKILDVPHVVHHLVSSEKQPHLGWLVPYFKLFMTGWEEL